MPRRQKELGEHTIPKFKGSRRRSGKVRRSRWAVRKINMT